jgi:MurNAc alpha-1-phosphate uridylyltransferase
MILAAGFGKRMHPLTLKKPKPLVEVADRPLIDWAFDFLAESEISNVVVNAAYKKDQLIAHLLERNTITIIEEEEDAPLETGGGILGALQHFNDHPFISMNADTILLNGDMPTLPLMADAFDPNHMDALLAVFPREKAVGYHGKGDFFVNEDGTFRRRRAKEATAPYVFTGLQIIHPRLFENAPDGAFSLNLLYNRHVAEDGTFERLRAIPHPGHWLHIGTPDAITEAEKYLTNKSLFSW